MMRIKTSMFHFQQKIISALIILGIFAQFYLCMVPDLFIPNPAINELNLIFSGVVGLIWLILCCWTYCHSTRFRPFFASYFSVNILRYFAILAYLAISVLLISFAVKGVESLLVKQYGEPATQTVSATKLQQEHSKGDGSSYFIVSPTFQGANRSGLIIDSSEYQLLPANFYIKLIGKQSELGFTVLSYQIIK